ncbi:MAG: helicase-exonuclease AddAB subunit AddA [Faecousia sp.]
MADKLTPQQAQAVHDRGGKLLVSAAAGSGKTKVLVDRLMTYLTDPVSPANLDDFLIITYTKAAASELRGKIAAKLTERIAQDPENRHLQKQMQRLFLTKISTVHGFCGDLLREYAYKLDLSADFRVADENECQEIRENVLTELLDQAYLADRQDADFRSFVDSQGLGRDDRTVPELILKVYDSAHCHLCPDGWLEQCIENSTVEQGQDVSQTIWGQFLMEDLREYLDAQILVMGQCTQEAEQCEGLEKQAANLRSTLQQLQQLRENSCWDDIVQHRKIDYGRLVFPKKNPDPELTDRIKAARTACKKGLEKKLQSFSDESAQLMSDLQQCAAGTRGLVALVRQFDREFSRAKRIRRVLDFGDLEHKTLDLLLGQNRTSTTQAAREIGRRFREIMVDEYQDSNGVQDAIFGALTQEKQNCFMVGDVKQSIYQFRLADPGIFLEKYHHYVPASEAQPGQGRKVLLSHNFRSGPEVISAVNDVFSHCMSPRVGGLQYGEGEALREGVPHDLLPGQAVQLHALEVREETYREEADYVADQIATMLRSNVQVRGEKGLRPVEPEDIVILLRSPGSVGGYFQRALEGRGIRCSSGSGSDLLETEEIGMLRSFLAVIVNPRQDIPLISTLASPVFGFTADDLAQIRSRQKKGSFYDALLESGLPKANQFLDMLTTLRQTARSAKLTQLLEKCFAMTRLDSLYGAMEGGEARQANLQTLFQLATDYEQGGLRDLSQFLQYLDTLQGKGLLGAGTGSSGCVTIMSIHKSKGLEFPVVFLCGLARGFNRESLNSQILCDRELGLGLSVADPVNRVRYPSIAKRAIMVKSMRESLSEEMRVLYVAMTRARDRLIMTYAPRNLEADLQDMSLRLDFDRGTLLSREASCPGEWILLAAVQHLEAGQLHALGGRPMQTTLGEIPWGIFVASAPEPSENSLGVQIPIAQMPVGAAASLTAGLSFHYAHQAATKAPSKQTATDRKGRQKDAEAAEHTPQSHQTVRRWRKPTFISAEKDGRAYGNAIHAAMQYIRYENCGTLDEVRKEIRRLLDEGYLSEEQFLLVDCERIAAFFQSELGRKLVAGVSCLREFKFSILDEGSHYGEDLQEEQILLQGVVDCALLEGDGITILDFKTDRVSEKTAKMAAERYRPQVETYGQALSRIYELPVKAKYLYFFNLDALWEL